MTQGGDCLLLRQSLAADRTLLALGQAGFGTGRSLAGDGFFLVTQGGNFFLCSQSLATNGALLTIGQAGFGTGRSLAGDDLLSVAGGGDLFLCSQSLAADGALLTLGQTGVGAGCCLAGDGFFLVTQSGNDDRLPAQFRTADITVNRQLIGAVLRAVRCGLMLLCGLACAVSQRRDLPGNICIAAAGTGIGGIASLFAVGIGNLRLIIMAQGRNFFLCSQNLTTDRALSALSQAGFGAGYRLAGDDLLRVTQGGDFVGHIGNAADCAHMGGIAIGGTGGRGDDAVLRGVLRVHLAVHIEHILSVFKVPAILQGVDQGIAVVEGGIIRAEGCAPVAGIIGIDVGSQTVGLLICGIAREGIQRTGGQIEFIAQSGAVGGHQAVVLVPGGLRLRCQFDPADHTDGVGGGGLDGRGLLHPIQADVQHIGLGIQLRTAQGEIFILQAQPGQIYIEIGIDPDLCADLGQDTDPVSQLQQEAPGGAVGLVRAGQHVGQILQPLGNRDGGHIQGEGVVGHHGLVGVDHMVGVAVGGGGVGDLPQPGQAAVAAGGVVEIEDHVAGVIHGDGDGVADAAVGGQGCGNGDGLQAGCLIAGEIETADGAAADALVTFADRKAHILRRKGNGLSAVQRGQGQRCRLPIIGVDVRGGEVKGIGVHHVQLQSADPLAVQAQENLPVAQRLGREDAVAGNRADLLIGNRPDKLSLGNGHLSAPGGNAGGGECNGCIGRQICIFRSQNRMVKGGVIRRGGDHQQHSADLGVIARVVGEGFLGLLSGNEGGLRAAVQQVSGDTARIQQDLSQLRMGGAVHSHEHGLAGLRHTGGSSGSAHIGIRGRACALQHQCGAGQSCQEAFAVAKGTGGNGAGIDARDDIGIVLPRLIQQGARTHTGIDPHIAAPKIRGGHIIVQLLSVRGRGGIHLPEDARSQGDGFGGIRGEGIAAARHIVARQLPQVVGKGIADRHAQIIEQPGIGDEGSRPLQGGVDPVAHIGPVNGGAEPGAVGDAVHSVRQEVRRPILVGQPRHEVALQNVREQTGVIFLPRQLSHNIVGIQVAVHILPSEGLDASGDVIPGEDGLDHLLHSFPILHIGLAVHQIQQVHQVACPARHIRMVAAAGVVAGDVHGAEHVGELQGEGGIAGRAELLQLPEADHADQLRGIGHAPIVNVLIGRNIGGEIGVLIARHDGPGSGGIAGDAAADVIEHQRRGICAGIFLRIAIRDLLQKPQILQEGLIVGNTLPLQDGVFVIGGVVAAGAFLVCVPAHAGVGGKLGSMVHKLMPQGGDRRIVAVAADGTGIGSDAVLGAGGDAGDGAVAVVMTGSGNGIAHMAVAADGAGIGGETLLRAGGSGHHGLVAVAGGGRLFAQIAVAAVAAGIGGIARCSAGGGGDHAGVGVSGGGDGLRPGLTAAGAGVADAAGVGAVRLRPVGLRPCMSQGGDHAACLLHIVAAAAICAGGFAGLGAGGILAGGIDHVMPQSIDLLRPLPAAGGADRGLHALGLTAGGSGDLPFVPAVSGSRDSDGLPGQFRAADRAANHGVIASAFGAGCIHNVFPEGFPGLVAGSGDRLRIGAAALAAGVGGASLLGTGLGGGDGGVAVDALHAPDAVLIAIGVGGGGQIAAAFVLKLCRGNVDGGVGNAGSVLGGLISRAGGDGGQLHDAALNAGDRRAAFRGIELARGGIQSARHMNGGIAGDGAGAAGGTLVGSSGGIGHDPQLGAAVDIAAPLILVVDIQPDARAQGAGCALIHDQLGIGLEGQILADGCGAALKLNGDAAVDGQHIVAGIDGGQGDRQGHGLEAHGAVGSDVQPVGGAVILLGHGAGGQVEHGTAGADELDRGMILGAGHVQGGVAVLGSTGLQCHGRFHILHIVLAQGEDLVIVARHGQRCRAAPEVDDLEILIHTCAGHDLHTALTGDVAIGIELSVDLDRAALAQRHVAVLAHRSAAAAVVPRGDTQRAVDGQIRAAGQGQGAVGRGGGDGGGTLGSRGECAAALIKGDQQGDAGGNGILPRAQGSVVHQGDHVAAFRRSHGVIQIEIGRIADPEAGIAALGQEHGLHSNILGRIDGIGCVPRCDLAAGGIDPAGKGIAGGRLRHQNRALAGGDPLQGGAGGDGSAVGGDAASCAVIFHGDPGGLLGSGQGEVCQLQRGGGGFEQRAAGGGHGHGFGCSGLHHAAPGAGIGSFGEGEGSAGGAVIVKADRSHGAGGVGDGDGIAAGLSGGKTAGARDCDGDGTAGDTDLGGRIRHGDLTAQNRAGGRHRLKRRIVRHDCPGKLHKFGVPLFKPVKLLFVQLPEPVEHGFDPGAGRCEGALRHGVHRRADLLRGHGQRKQMLLQKPVRLMLKLQVHGQLRFSGSLCVHRVVMGRLIRMGLHGQHGEHHGQHQQQADPAFYVFKLHIPPSSGIFPVYCTTPAQDCPRLLRKNGHAPTDSCSIRPPFLRYTRNGSRTFSHQKVYRCPGTPCATSTQNVSQLSRRNLFRRINDPINVQELPIAQLNKSPFFAQKFRATGCIRFPAILH